MLCHIILNITEHTRFICSSLLRSRFSQIRAHISTVERTYPNRCHGHQSELEKTHAHINSCVHISFSSSRASRRPAKIYRNTHAHIYSCAHISHQPNYLSRWPQQQRKFRESTAEHIVQYYTSLCHAIVCYSIYYLQNTM